MGRSVDSDDTTSSEFSDEINRLTDRITGAAIHVHRELGPGLLEKTYEACLAAELRHRGLRVERQVPVQLIYRDIELEVGYRIDILVENKVVVELKVAKRLEPVFVSQVMTYLRLSGLHAGLLSSTTAWTHWLQAGSSAWSGVAQ